MIKPPPLNSLEYVDWYLPHKWNNLGHKKRATWVWEFTLRTRDVAGMKALSTALRKRRYLTAEQEVVMDSTCVETPSARKGGKPKLTWTTVEGPPMVTAFARGLPSAAALKRRVRAIIELGEKMGATYHSMSSMELKEFEQIYGPPRAMPLEDAIWWLRQQADLGMKAGAKFDIPFAVLAKDARACKAALRKAGYAKFDRPPKDADWTFDVLVPGKNNEALLKREYAALKLAAKKAGGTLKGVVP